MSIQLGSVTIDAPVILAPMSGVTDQPFRKTVKTLRGWVGGFGNDRQSSHGALGQRKLERMP